jgi:hypothetical protein
MSHVPKVNDTYDAARIIFGNKDVVGRKIVVNNLGSKFRYTGEHVPIEAIEEVADQFLMICIINIGQKLSK